MSEKRFTFGAVSPNVAMIKNNGEPMDIGEVVDKLNTQQDNIQSLKEENDKLRELIKGNVFGRYREGSFADLEFKAIAYDDIVKLEMSYESEPKVIVFCKQGKKENVISFCQMFIPVGVYYEIKEVIG